MQPPQPQTSPTWKTWHKVTLIVIGALAVLLVPIVIIAALATDDDTDTPPTEETATAPAELVDAVTAVAPDTDPDEILDNAESVCLDIEQGKEDETLARNAALRFGIDEGDGHALVEAIEPHCGAIR